MQVLSGFIESGNGISEVLNNALDDRQECDMWSPVDNSKRAVAEYKLKMGGPGVYSVRDFDWMLLDEAFTLIVSISFSASCSTRAISSANGS